MEKLIRIEFHNASDVEKFVDFMLINNLKFQQDESGLTWFVDEDTAKKIIEAHPYYDYWCVTDVE